jgi:hypothetical protein
MNTEQFVAEVLNPDGTVYDHTYNWETAQNIALHEGRKINVLCDDGGMTKAEIQALCDAELERYNDCFGVDNES